MPWPLTKYMYSKAKVAEQKSKKNRIIMCDISLDALIACVPYSNHPLSYVSLNESYVNDKEKRVNNSLHLKVHLIFLSSSLSVLLGVCFFACSHRNISFDTYTLIEKQQCKKIMSKNEE